MRKKERLLKGEIQVKHFGKCALCGKECNLSFEHIPPESAFNNSPAKPVSGDKLVEDDDRMPWDTSGLKYEHQQRGMGKYSLCRECNSFTGVYYGKAYTYIARIMHVTLHEEIDPKYNAVGIKDIYPLRFIKQVLSMFCSINNSNDSRFDDLRAFVLDKNAVGIDKAKYKICMYFTKSNLTKYASFSVLLKQTAVGLESMAVSEITAYPLGFILYFNPTDTWEYDGFDITSFTDYNYDDKFTFEFPLCVKEVNDFFPTFFRTKEEIQECIKTNKKWAEENHKKD